MTLKIEFSQTEKDLLVGKIQQYFNDELHDDIGQFEAEFLIDFFSENLGQHYYNRGLSDARVAMRIKLEDLDAEIEGLEKPSNSTR